MGRRRNPKIFILFSVQQEAIRGFRLWSDTFGLYFKRSLHLWNREEIGGEQSGQLSCSRRHRIHLCAAESAADACALPRIIAFLPGLFSEPPSSKHLICVLA